MNSIRAQLKQPWTPWEFKITNFTHSAAIVLPLCISNNHLSVLLTKRSRHLRRHAGEMR
jgi:hypothetical protein